MTDFTEFKRMNFFTGFFTTAEDWNQGQNYHLEKRKLHNRGLHTPGIIRGEKDELRVTAADGLNIRVEPGAALDGAGNEVYLGQSRTLEVELPETLPADVYVAIEYGDEPADWVENVEAPQYSGYTRVLERATLSITTSVPDNQNRIELARIALQPGVTGITNDEIDRSYVVWAGSVGVTVPQLAPAILERIILLMQDKRRDFAALDARFPVPSSSDVRHAALTMEMMAHSSCLRPEQVADVLATIAAVEQDVGQEIGVAYPVVTTIPEFQAYQDAVAALLTALRVGQGLDTLLTRQGEVAEAARELSEVVIQLPVADAGLDQALIIPGDEVTVTLDASDSEAYGGREVDTYRWNLVESHVRPPAAYAGPDRTISTAGDEATARLDASGSHAFEGREIERYHWDRRE